MEIVGEALEGLKRSPQWYTQSAAARDKHLWTFGAWDGLRYSDNSRALFEYTLANCPEIKAVWMTKSPKVYERLYSKGLPVELCYSESGKAVQRKAGYFFLTKGPDDGDPLQMRGCHLIWLWHGMPLKQIGRDSMAFLRKNTLWKRVKTAIRQKIVPWQFLSGETLSSAPFFTPFLQSAFGLPADMVWEVGYPRNDHFFKTDVTERIISDLHSRFDRKDATQRAKATRSTRFSRQDSILPGSRRCSKRRISSCFTRATSSTAPTRDCNLQAVSLRSPTTITTTSIPSSRMSISF